MGKEENLSYKHTNGLRGDLKEDCFGIRASCIRGKKKSKRRNRVFKEISSESIK